MSPPHIQHSTVTAAALLFASSKKQCPIVPTAPTLNLKKKLFLNIVFVHAEFLDFCCPSNRNMFVNKLSRGT